MAEIDLIATRRISVLAGYYILGAKDDGSPKLRAKSREIPTGVTFRVEAKLGEELIRSGDARLSGSLTMEEKELI